MVGAVPPIGTRRAPTRHVIEGAATDPGRHPHVWIVEDEPASAELAVELCEGAGAATSVFRAALPFVSAMRERLPPDAVVLDWRLEHELSAAVFLAVRHRYPALPVVYWTGHPSATLPSMIRDDGRTTVVDKADGADAFERAIAWAVGLADRERSGA